MYYITIKPLSTRKKRVLHTQRVIFITIIPVFIVFLIYQIPIDVLFLQWNIF